MFEEFEDKPRMQTKSGSPMLIGVLAAGLLIGGGIAANFLLDDLIGRDADTARPTTRMVPARAPANINKVEKSKQDVKPGDPTEAPAKEKAIDPPAKPVDATKPLLEKGRDQRAPY